MSCAKSLLPETALLAAAMANHQVLLLMVDSGQPVVLSRHLCFERDDNEPQRRLGNGISSPHDMVTDCLSARQRRPAACRFFYCPDDPNRQSHRPCCTAPDASKQSVFDACFCADDTTMPEKGASGAISNQSPGGCMMAQWAPAGSRITLMRP